jgi:transposase
MQSMVRFFEKLLIGGPVVTGYEAGCMGFEPQRKLSAMGVDCVVVAPGLIPRGSLSHRLRTFLESSERARALRRSSHRISSQVERRYRRLGAETRETLRDAHAQFQNLCGQCLMVVKG